MRFVQTLADQSYRNFRLIVVDQNGDDRFETLLASYDFPILHLRSEPGLSRARNVALGHVDADVVGFPDDDCWYPPHLLEQVVDLLSTRSQCDGLGGRAVDEQGRRVAGRPDSGTGPMTMFNLWKRVGSYTVFLRRNVVTAVGPFDEALGVGSGTPWGGAEDLDYIARSLRLGFRICYEPGIAVHHPRRGEHSADPSARRGYEYGAGLGRVLRKNRLPWWFAIYYFGRSFGAAAVSLLTGSRSHAGFYWAVGRGRMRGWRGDGAG